MTQNSGLQTFRYGGAVFPLASSTANTLLKDADPALYTLLDYYEAALNLHIGARLVAEFAAANMPAITSAVSYKAPLDVAPFLREAQYTFPLLAMYRMTSKYPGKTASFDTDESTWGLDYVLPPMSAGQAERIYPIMHAAAKVIDHATHQGFDPNYQSGAPVMRLAGIQQLSFVESVFGTMRAVDQTDLDFYSFRATLTVVERTAIVASAFDNLAGSDVGVSVSATGTTDLDGVADFKSDVTVG